MKMRRHHSRLPALMTAVALILGGFVQARAQEEKKKKDEAAPKATKATRPPGQATSHHAEPQPARHESAPVRETPRVNSPAPAPVRQEPRQFPQSAPAAAPVHTPAESNRPGTQMQQPKGNRASEPQPQMTRPAGPGGPPGGRNSQEVAPVGQRFPAGNDARVVPAGPGRQFGGGAPARPAEQAVRPLPGGGTARYNAAGRPTEIRRNGLTVHEVPGGVRQTVIERPGGRTVVAYGHGGYVQHGFVSHSGQNYVQRSYYVNGRAYARVYRPYEYRGVIVNVYAPPRYYAPSFYTYAYNPWRTPVIYGGWGWQATPWFGVYGGFFTPYPVYTSPALWLTDYIIAASFQTAYQMRLEAGLNNGNNFSQPMSPQLKQQIANEVQMDLQRQEREAQGMNGNQASGLPILDNRPHTLQVYTSVNAFNQGRECVLSESDIVEFNGAAPADGVNANVFVRYSRQQDCPVNSIASVPVDQLQEMSNHMVETMEQGLADLQRNQGRNGLPPLPPAMTATTQAEFSREIPPVEADVQSELSRAASEGTAALGEAGVQPGGAPGDASPNTAETPTLTLGQTQQQVMSILGEPQRRAIVGTRVILFYKDMKVTLENGVVTDIQ